MSRCLAPLPAQRELPLDNLNRDELHAQLVNAAIAGAARVIPGFAEVIRDVEREGAQLDLEDAIRRAKA